MIRSILSKIRWFTLNYFKARKIASNGPFIYFDLSSNPYDRYLYILALFFQSEGYTLIFKSNFNFLASWSTHLLIKGVKSLILVRKKPKNVLLSFSDYSSNDFDYLLSPDWFNNHKDALKIPMPMVDTFYVYSYDKFINESSKMSSRPISVFFAGNFNRSDYLRDELQVYFGLSNRIEMYKAIDNSGLQVFKPKSASFWKNYSLDPVKLLIADRNKAYINPKELLRFLGLSNFFIAFPGVVMPFCHNVIEAMACGCIPIINYSNLFHPELEDGINCICYDSEESLINKINIALEMDSTEIELMRQNVIKYFNDYLSVSSVIKKILTAKDKTQVHCVLMAEYNSVKLISD